MHFYSQQIVKYLCIICIHYLYISTEPDTNSKLYGEKDDIQNLATSYSLILGLVRDLWQDKL